MITGIGVDLVTIARMRRLCTEDSGNRFAKRILTPEELQEFKTRKESAKDPAVFLAKRFAIKEATAKALGTGFQQGLAHAHIGLDHDELGKPLLRFFGKAADWVRERQITGHHVSLSDEQESVIAFVVLEAERKIDST